MSDWEFPFFPGSQIKECQEVRPALENSSIEVGHFSGPRDLCVSPLTICRRTHPVFNISETSALMVKQNRRTGCVEGLQNVLSAATFLFQALNASQLSVCNSC